MERTSEQVGNDKPTSKLAVMAFKVADQSRVCISCFGEARRQADGRLVANVDKLVEAVDEYRKSSVQP
ncbi:hypothetical protein [Massilia sp. PWRC2]|uniref:hypothetical protein n=1 Tax=Massilia sp. PWRC2 TaxID=2804626 RepID=UPI003CEDB7CD